MAIMNCRKMPTSVVYRSFRTCDQRMKVGEANRSKAFEKTNNLQQKDDPSSSLPCFSSRIVASVPKPPTAVRGVPTKSSKSRRFSADDSEAVSVKSLERKGAKRQRKYTDIEDGRMGNLGSMKVDGGLGLRRNSETFSSTYSGNSPVCHAHASSSRRLVSVPKPSTAVRGVPTKSSKRPRCSEDDFEAIVVKGRERKGAKRQMTSSDIEDTRLGNLDSNKVDGAVGLRKSSELCLSTYSGNSPVCRPPLKATKCDENKMNLLPEMGSRVAMLLTRFGDIILKAQRHTAGETKGLETTEAKIARLRNVETNRAKEFVMQQRLQDREAARVALDEMERNANIEDNFKVMKEIQTLLSGQQSSVVEFRKYFRLLQ